MNHHWNRDDGTLGLGARLHVRRAEPSDELVGSILDRIAAGRRARQRARLRAGFATVLTGSMLASLSLVGGVGYAASAAREALHAVKRAAVPAKRERVIIVRGLTSGGDQYRPGFGFGDPDHNHAGPPGVERQDDAPVLTARASREGLARLVTTKISFSEQAGLWISVIDPRGTPLLLTQRSRRGGSRIGRPVSGPQTKFIQYALLVPRTVTIQLRIPANLLSRRRVYRIRILAIDPDGNRSTIFVPFRG